MFGAKAQFFVLRLSEHAAVAGSFLRGHAQPEQLLGIQKPIGMEKFQNPQIALGQNGRRVLCLFENPSALKAAADRLLSDANFTEPLRRQFAFSTLEGVQENFLENWHFLVPGRRTIFDLDPEAAQDGGETSGQTEPDNGEGGLLWGS